MTWQAYTLEPIEWGSSTKIKETKRGQWWSKESTSVCQELWWLLTAVVHLWLWLAWRTARGGCRTPPLFLTGQRCQCIHRVNQGGGNTPLWSCLGCPGGRGQGERWERRGAKCSLSLGQLGPIAVKRENQRSSVKNINNSLMMYWISHSTLYMWHIDQHLMANLAGDLL